MRPVISRIAQEIIRAQDGAWGKPPRIWEVSHADYEEILKEITDDPFYSSRSLAHGLHICGVPITPKPEASK